MNKVSILIGLSVLITIVSAGVAPCPLQSNIGSIVSARIIVAQQQSLVILTPNVDTQCYNYSLPYAFASVPEIAIGVHDFEAKTSNDLFFSIKPLQSTSLGYVPFLIRTHWRYTYWNKIAFSFLAEDRKDLESGYYQIDSGTLGGCQAGKSIQVLLPFRSVGLKPGQINHNIFLHGFEISAFKYDDNAYSPFEVQLVQSTTNSSGIVVLISVTTITQVHALHISYLAWIATDLNMVVGSYSYTYTLGNLISHTPVTNLGRNYARLYGLTGFIINYNYQSLSFSTEWTGIKFNFNLATSQSLTQYFTFQYVFFIGSECSDCPGYPYIFGDQCYELCPPGSFPTAEKICISCGENFFWDGVTCKKLCPEGQILNATTNICECPAGSNWTGTVCITCTSGRIYDPLTAICKCPNLTRWNGFTCAKLPDCTSGREWDIFKFTCECPIGTFWNSTYCVRRTVCPSGQVANAQNLCVCPDGTSLKNGWCQATGCIGGQVWNGETCACSSETRWNGTVCLLCINGQIWDSGSSQCLCPPNFSWNGNFCEKFVLCSSGRIYNKEYDQCLCPEKQFWNGASCIVKQECCCGKTWNETSFGCNCPTGFNWDGSKCVFCVNGRYWEPTSNTCQCRFGTQWNGQFCAVIQNCQGGMIWNQNTWACECPSTAVWNGINCIANKCTGGQVWDNVIKTCICVGGKIFVDGNCIIPQSLCTYGRIWSKTELKCLCPIPKWDSGVACVDITSCTSNQIYNPFNNKCTCPPYLVWLSSKNSCGDPTCPYGQRWDGYGCKPISCPPGSYFNGTECICPDLGLNCLPWEFFDGQKCIYFIDTCPQGTRWNSSHCTSISNCPIGYYGENNICKPFPQKCVPPTNWNQGKCQVSGNSCPVGSFFQSGSCNPYTSCQNGQNWDRNLLQCVCPEGTGWNGASCTICGGGQIWSLDEGCTCPDGHFFAGSTCEKASQTRCANIPNAIWYPNKNLCQCAPGFTISGYSCVCKGVPFENFCDRCAFRPHSTWNGKLCQCETGYTLYGSECLPNLNNGTDSPTECGVGTFFDVQQKKCLSCPDGCLSCSDCYTCLICNVGFDIDRTSSLCYEFCGDGKRFTDRIECDDGNINDGDGCSKSCKIEAEYTCRGGSPATPDSCILYKPTFITITQTGTVRYSTRILVNIKLDYLPLALIQSTDCNDRCNQVLNVKVTGQSQPVSIVSRYIPGSRYSFSVEIEFGKSYMSKFSLNIGVSPSIVSKYFPSVSVRNGVFEINPAFLSTAQKDVLK